MSTYPDGVNHCSQYRSLDCLPRNAVLFVYKCQVNWQFLWGKETVIFFGILLEIGFCFLASHSCFKDMGQPAEVESGQLTGQCRAIACLPVCSLYQWFDTFSQSRWPWLSLESHWNLCPCNPKYIPLSDGGVAGFYFSFILCNTSVQLQICRFLIGGKCLLTLCIYQCWQLVLLVWRRKFGIFLLINIVFYSLSIISATLVSSALAGILLKWSETALYTLVILCL